VGTIAPGREIKKVLQSLHGRPPFSSNDRIKLLVRFFFNPESQSYLRELAKEFEVSTNAVREELNQLNKTNLVTKEKNGRQVYYRANQKHPLTSTIPAKGFHT